MALANTGNYDNWIVDRIYFKTLTPATGNTGTFDNWLADRIYYEDYVEAQPRGGRGRRIRLGLSRLKLGQ